MASSTKRRSVRQAATRKRSIYVDPDTDDEFAIDSEADYEPDEVSHSPPPRKRIKTATRHKPHTRSKAKSKSALSAVGKPRKVNSKVLPEQRRQFSGPSDGKVPAWTTLPVNILKDIFVFASQPIHGQASLEIRSDNIKWLLTTARICRAFALPALEAYYNSPSLPTSLHPHKLLDLLRLPADNRYINYSAKIQSLYIDVRQLAYTAHNRPAFKLGALVHHLPRLQHMEVLHPVYLPPYRLPFKLQRWTFIPRDLFVVMHERHIMLKSWRWSRDMIPQKRPDGLYERMAAAHETEVFSRLIRLTVCGFNVDDSSEPTLPEDAESDQVQLPGLTWSIAKLPHLKDLTFISCDVIMKDSLQLLPSNLIRLELSNCLEITSELMQKFLDKSGGHLRELVLNHNPSLNLSFLQSLKRSSPQLEVLKMDMRYYSEKLVTNDAEALYEELLAADETPTWPTTLRRLELTDAQKWSADGAQNLFRSLIESASELLDLRSIIIHAHINIPWRARVGFRDQWTQRLHRVFQRRITNPVPYLGSLRQFREWKQGQGPNRRVISRGDDELPITGPFAQVQVSAYKASGDTDIYSDSEPLTPSQRQPRRSKRVAASVQTEAAASTTPTSTSESEAESGDDWRKQPEAFVQGLCEVVDVRIDNQRPRENQYTEGDFLDSEISGDEDYREGAEVGYHSDDSTAGGGYAW